MTLDSLSLLFSPPADPALLTYGIYDFRLVSLSILVASFASWMALQVAGLSAKASSRSLRSIALLTGSLALGSGVWAMHFIAMLAFNLCTAVDYDPTITVWSMLPSIVASYVALSLIARPTIGRRQLIGGGVLVGAGIGTMHYAGMAAMRTALVLRYDPLMFGLSIVVAVALASTALWVRFGLRSYNETNGTAWRLLLSAVVMGCAIAGMHYTGMAAARFVGPAGPGAGAASNATFVAVAIALMTVVFTVLVVAANGLLRYRAVFQHLREHESWLRALLATAIDGVITIDADNLIQEFNVSAERIFGWSTEEIVGRNICVLLSDPAAPNDGQTLQGTLLKGNAVPAAKGREILAMHKDGSRVPIRLAIGHARLAGRDRLVAFVTDLTERNAIETALRGSEQQLRSLIANIPGVTYRVLMDVDFPMLFVSDAVQTLTGYPASEFLGRPPSRHYVDLIHPDDRPAVWAEINAATQAHRSFQIEYRMRHYDGGTRWMWNNGCAVRDEHGDVKWLDGVILDISERRQMEEDLREAKGKAEQAAAARAAFVANMSHEIRTPMNSIIGFTDILLGGELSSDHRRHLDMVRVASGSLLRLLNEILDMAKLDRGAVELECADFSLLDLIEKLSASFGAEARGKGLAFDLNYASELPRRFHGDEMRIRQVLTNLLGNAIKFTARGSVGLDVAMNDRRVHFTVSDSGIGIPADRLTAIFQPFTQADASMTRRFGGTGLGVSICKGLVGLMDGRIWVDSTLGQGSVFHVEIPLAAARSVAQAPGKRHGVALAPLRILAVDDLALNLELLTLILEEHGHTLTALNDSAEAVRRAAAEAFDVVLLDVRMPGLNGLDATRQIRAAEAKRGTRRLPVIALTASALAADRVAARNAGMDGFAAKPINLADLTREIARVLGVSSDDANRDEPPVPLSAELVRRSEGRPAAGPSTTLAFDAEGVRTAGETLMRALQRGGLDETALATLTTALTGHVPAAALAALQRAIDDFDFASAQDRLASLVPVDTQPLLSTAP
jgi:PAS domain S-box-containing protein